MKIEINTLLTTGNTTTLKYLGNFISDLSSVAGYPAYILPPKKVCKMKILKNKSLWQTQLDLLYRMIIISLKIWQG